MKPNKLKRHFETTHKEHVGKPRSFSEKKYAKLNKQRVYFKKALTISGRALKASFKVIYLIARAMKPHSIAETLILLAAIEMAKTMCREEESQKLKRKFDWVRDPFHCDAGAVDLPATAAEHLIDLSYDITHWGLHSRVALEEFWFGARMSTQRFHCVL